MQDQFKKLDEFINNLESREGALISVLHHAQEIFGYLPQEVQSHIAKRLELPDSKVYGVVTFYSFFRTKPRGKNIIDICMGTACFVRGADAVLEEFKRQLNVQVGETTPDGLFTLESLRCVGACGLAPVVMVNGKTYGRVTTGDVKGIIEEHTKA